MTAATLALVAALILAAYFSAADTAFTSLDPARLRALVEERHTGSAALLWLRARPARLGALLHLGITFSDVLAAALAGYLAYPLGGRGLALAVGLLTAALLLAGKLVPVRISARNAEAVALLMAPPLRILARLLTPLLVPFERLVRVRPESQAPELEGLGEEALRQLETLRAQQGELEAHERDIIERAFRLDDIKAWDIMTPRVDVFAWQDSQTLTAIASQLGTVPFSRVPVFGESVDDITGVLYVRDAYQALLTGQRDVPLRELAREPLIVPGSVSLTKLLRDFQTRRIHLAIVVDEYGGTDGLVTLEDVLEELVGEIVDETDLAEEAIVRVSRSEMLAAGDADLREINHFFNTSFPQLEHRSLNGYLLDELGRVPDTGESLERDGIVIEVLEATETQVIRARLRRVAAPETPARPRPGEAPAVSHGSAPADAGAASTDLAPDGARAAGTGEMPAERAARMEAEQRR